MTMPTDQANAAGVLVRARNLRKTFQIHTRAASSLKEMVIGGFGGNEVTTHVALDNVSFDVPRGRSLAIVGSNGSGKSTLLKMISGISDPDSGTLEIHGRLAALLELGAGFHPDLTGMENIFLQGSILGLSRAEILDILDDVLDFCELGTFIHTPLKRYSSGMVVRLGFALAVYCEADLLLVDEVLAVGDMGFQKKCMRKISELRAEGRTIILVSHGLDQVEAAADDILWIEKGVVRAHGSLEEVLPLLKADLVDPDQGAHLATEIEANGSSENREAAVHSISGRGIRTVSENVSIEAVVFRDAEGRQTSVFQSGEPMIIEVDVAVEREQEFLEVQIGLLGYMDLRAAWCRSGSEGGALRNAPAGRYRFSGRVEKLPFAGGQLLCSVALVDDPARMHVVALHMDCYNFFVRGTEGDASVGISLPPGRFEAGDA